MQLVKDFTATSLIGPQATAAQTVNSQLVSCLYNCRYNLLFVEQEFPGKVWEIMWPTVKVGPNADMRLQWLNTSGSRTHIRASRFCLTGR